MRIIITLTLSLSLLGCAESSYAKTPEIDDSKAVYAVLGEAGQSYQERLVIAYALRNRGTLKGVYGYKRALGRSWTGSDWQNASRAVFEAKNGTPSDDLTHGATHWLSDYDLKHCKPRLTAFRFKMVETAYISNTHFYKEV